jgi:hypothetical protein
VLTSGPTSTAIITGSTTLKAVATVVALATLGTVGLHLATDSPRGSESPSVSEARPVDTDATSTSPLRDDDLVVPALPSALPSERADAGLAPASRQPREGESPRPRPRPAVSTPVSELELFRELQGAIVDRGPARALAIARQHQASYPDGDFAQEREALAIEALLSLDRRSEAETRAARFRTRYPQSPLRRRLDTLLGSE